MIGSAKGPYPARFLVVGESFGEEEARAGLPFVGASGKELMKMLSDAGILEIECRFTNLINTRPPGNDTSKFFCSSQKAAREEGVPLHFGKYPKLIIHDGLKELRMEIERTKPRVIIALGNYALWAVTGEFGITNWRGSVMHLKGPAGTDESITVIPTYHPAAILRQWSWRHIAIHDLRYAAEAAEARICPPDYQFTIRPSYATAIEILQWMYAYLEAGKRRLAVDIETRQGQIACIGIAWTVDQAICIPLLCTERVEGYWELEQEVEIVYLLSRILCHRNAQLIWQNGLYDLQYIHNNWHFIANITDDTMLMQHAVFPGLPKGLDFLRSMYCDYRLFWKNESKEWKKKMDEDILWRYNCTDCVVTFEIREKLDLTIRHIGVEAVYAHSMSLYEPVLFMMINGVRVDTITRDAMMSDLKRAMKELDEWIDFVLDQPFNVNSAQQMRRLFYDELQIPTIRDKKTGQPTLGAEALNKIYQTHTLLRPLIDRILLRRQVGVYYSTFLKPAIDPDNRDRCSYNIGGTETGRFSSSENAFGRGRNLENLPRPPEKFEVEPTQIVKLPNIRSLYIPDPGFVIGDFDLDRADAHIVAWESGDEPLKELFRAGIDIHSANATVIGSSRQLAKSFVHGTNYGGSARTMAINCGISKLASERGQFLWFKAHPAIQEWHDRVEEELMKTRKITTIWGRVRYYFDRIDIQTRNEALAYYGQSPVADVINKGLRNIYLHLPWCQLLLQNHDSVVVQFPNDNIAERVEEIRKMLLIPLPYQDPLIIPVGYKIGEKSWGELH